MASIGLGEVLEWDTEDEGEYTFPDGAQRIEDLELKLLGRGVSGCVISVKLDQGISDSEYGGRNPIAIKYTLPIRDSETEYLILIQIRQIESQLTYEGILLGPKIFSVFKVDRQDVDDDWLEFMLRICPDLFEDKDEDEDSEPKSNGDGGYDDALVPVRKPIRKYLYVSETEQMDGTLNEVSHKLGRPWTLSETRAISFQVCKYMATVQDLLELNHRDMRASNVLMSKLTTGEQSTATGYPWKGDSSSSHSFSYVVKVSDYGLSTTKLTTPSTTFSESMGLPFAVLPIDWMLVAEEESSWRVPGQDVSMADDIWSFGLLLLNTFMQNHDFYQFLTMDPERKELLESRDPVRLERDHHAPYEYDLIHQVVENHEPFKTQIRNLVRDNWRIFGTNVDLEYLQNRVIVLISMCQIQYFLGNGFLPSKASLASKPNSLYKILEDTELQLLLRRSAQVDPSDPQTNVFQFMVYKFGAETSSSSYSGQGFLQKCLSWDKSARNTFGSTRPGLERFSAALEDPFLSYRGESSVTTFHVK